MCVVSSSPLFPSLATERSDIDKSAITALDSTTPSVAGDAGDAGEYTINCFIYYSS